MRQLLGFLLFAALVVAPSLAAAQPAPRVRSAAQGAAAAGEAASTSQAQEAERTALARQIVRRREEAMGREALDERFVRDWVSRLAQLPVERLRDLAALADPGDLQAAVSLSSPALPQPDGVVASDLGDSGHDLVYTKVTPCRVADTRNVLNPLANGSLRDFYVSGTNAANFGAQGGAPCGIPVGATAVVVNLTVTGTAGYGWLRAYPYGGTGAASVINYAPGDTLANGLVLPICDPAGAACTFDLEVAADAAGTHLLIDVMGYFMKPSALGTLRTFTTTSATPFGSPALTLPEANGCAPYTSIVVTAPGPGQVQVTAKVLAHLAHTSGTANEVWWGLSAAPGAQQPDCTSFSTSFGGSSSLFLVDGTQATAAFDTWDSIRWVFDAAAAGSYTFYLNAKKVSGAVGSAQLKFGGLTATFQPR